MVPFVLPMWNSAWAQSFGTSYKPHEFAANGDTAINVSLTAANGDVWVAIEWAASLISPEPNLRLEWWDGGSWTGKGIASGEMTSGTRLIYPSIVSWPGEDYVYMVSKQDQSPSGVAQYKFYRQDRDDMTASPSTTYLGSVGSTIVHQRSHIAYDYQIEGTATEKMFLCWTQSTTSNNQEDLYHAFKESTDPWSTGATTASVSIDTDDDDDHCESHFNHDSRVFTTYHSQKNGGDHIFMQFAYLHPALGWVGIQSGQLDDPTGITSGFDFPATWIRPLSSSNSLGFIVAKSLNADTNLVYWMCEGDTADCDGASEWASAYQDVSGFVHQPNVVVTEQGHAFVVAESASQDYLSVFEWCNGDSGWSDAGQIVTQDTDHDDSSPKIQFGVLAGNATPVVAWMASTNTLHVAFVAERDGTSNFNPFRWRGDLTNDLCQ